MMAEVDFYYARSGNSLRAAIALELGQWAYNKHEIDLTMQEHKTEAFLKINPAGRVPVVVLSNCGKPIILTQSGAIMDYVIRRNRPDLWPTEFEKNINAMACFFTAISDISVQNGLSRYLKDNREVRQYLSDRMWHEIFTICESLKNHDFLCGQEKSIADYANFPTIYMHEQFLKKRTNASHILDWLALMKEDAAVKRAITFSGFQLSG